MACAGSVSRRSRGSIRSCRCWCAIPRARRSLVAHLRERGILATGLAFPVVPKGEEEIRFQISADHTTADIDEALAALAQFQATTAGRRHEIHRCDALSSSAASETTSRVIRDRFAALGRWRQATRAAARPTSSRASTSTPTSRSAAGKLQVKMLRGRLQMLEQWARTLERRVPRSRSVISRTSSFRHWGSISRSARAER